MVDPPDPCGDKVGQDDIYAVVPPSHQQEEDPGRGGEEGGPAGVMEVNTVVTYLAMVSEMGSVASADG